MAAATGQKIIASDENPRWQRTVGDLFLEREYPGGIDLLTD
jgi:hypothetical protein